MSDKGSLNSRRDFIAGCEVLYSSVLNPAEVLKCIEIFKNRPLSPTENTLGFKGRGQPIKISLRENLNLIFRRNRRGGIVGKVLKFKYFSNKLFLKNARPFKEFNCLKHLRTEGIPVPEPVLAIVQRKGLVFYEGGLFSRELTQAQTLLDVLDDTDILKLREYAYSAGLWAVRALALGYLHSDLHLGNVLVRSSGISLIDFDKYKNLSDKSRGIKYLQKRWDRGVEKRVENIEIKTVLKESFLAGMRYGERS